MVIFGVMKIVNKPLYHIFPHFRFAEFTPLDRRNTVARNVPPSRLNSGKQRTSGSDAECKASTKPSRAYGHTSQPFHTRSASAKWTPWSSPSATSPFWGRCCERIKTATNRAQWNGHRWKNLRKSSSYEVSKLPHETHARRVQKWWKLREYLSHLWFRCLRNRYEAYRIGNRVERIITESTVPSAAAAVDWWNTLSKHTGWIDRFRINPADLYSRGFSSMKWRSRFQMFYNVFFIIQI